MQKQQRKQEALNQTAKFNVDIVKMKQAIARGQKEAEEEFIQMDIDTTKNSKLLVENHQDTLRADNPNRFIPYNFKGYTMETHKQFHDDRLKQIEEKKQRHSEQQGEDKIWAQTMDGQRRYLRVSCMIIIFINHE